MGRYFAGAPEAYGGEGCSYSEASLPDSIPRTGVACLLVEIDCALASATDVALIGAALAPPGRIRM